MTTFGTYNYTVTFVLNYLSSGWNKMLKQSGTGAGTFGALQDMNSNAPYPASDLNSIFTARM